MIRAIARKELVANRALLVIALVLVMLVSSAMPFFFSYVLRRAVASIGNDTALSVIASVRSYPVFLESNWLARNLARILCLLALLGGAGAIAGEREDRTLPLLYTSSVPLGVVMLLKFAFVAVWLGLVTFASSAVLAAHSLIESDPFPVFDVAVASVVAWANAIAFLGVVFAASAVANRTAIAAALALAAGFLIAFALRPLGLNGTALALDVFGNDGAIAWRHAGVDVLVAFAIAGLGLFVALLEVDRRRAT